MPVGDLYEYTFPTANYAKYSVTGSKPEIDGCEAAVEYQVEYCDLVALQSPTTVEKDVSTNISTWFTTGANTNTSYTASWGSTVTGITSPYTFTQAADTQVTILVKDNVIGGCQASKTVTVTAPPPPPYCPVFSDFSPNLGNSINMDLIYSGTWGSDSITYNGPSATTVTLRWYASGQSSYPGSEVYPYSNAYQTTLNLIPGNSFTLVASPINPAETNITVNAQLFTCSL
jgi:hypothetical protein